MPVSLPWTDMHLIWTDVGVADVITCDRFFGGRLRGVDSVGVENCPILLIRPVAVNTGLALLRSL